MLPNPKPPKTFAALAKVIPFRLRQPQFEATFIPIVGSEDELARAAYLAAIADHTIEGRALERIARRLTGHLVLPLDARLVVFTASSFISGVDFSDGRMLRKGSLEPVSKWLEAVGGSVQKNVAHVVSGVRDQGGKAIVVASEKHIRGVVALRRSKTA